MSSNNQKLSKTDLAMALVSSLKLLTDGKTTYAVIGQQNVRTTLADVTCSDFREWLRSEMYKQHGTSCTPQALKDVTAHLKQEAKKITPVKFNRRFAKEDQLYYIDLGKHDSDELIEVSQDGWKVEPNKGIPFTTDTNLKDISVPIKQGNPLLIFKYLNIRNRKHVMLVLAWLCSLPLQVTHPILLLKGRQDSGKTTTGELLRRVMDNSHTLNMSEPSNDSDLALAFFTNSVCLFDNMGRISNAVANMFCKAVTGDGHSKRALFTDSQQIHYQYKRPIIITSIGWLTEKSDFLSRCMTIPMNSIDSDKSFGEEYAEEHFQRDLPLILGGALDYLVKALKLRDHIRLKHKTRMGDFDRIGCAIALVAGYDPAEFMEARLEIDRDSYLHGKQRSFFMALKQLLKDNGGAIQMNAKDLADDLSSRLEKAGYAPISEHSVGTNLSRNRNQLASAKIQFTKSRKNGATEYTITANHPAKGDLVEVMTNCLSCKHFDTAIMKEPYCTFRKQLFTPRDGEIECSAYELNLFDCEIPSLPPENIQVPTDKVNMDELFGVVADEEEQVSYSGGYQSVFS